MAEARRRDDEWEAAQAGSPPEWAGRTGGQVPRPGGPVGQIQADLVRRLACEATVTPVTPGERLVRRVSVAGGWLALLAGYAGAAFLLLR